MENIKIEINKDFLKNFCKGCPEWHLGTCNQEDFALLSCNLIQAIQESKHKYFDINSKTNSFELKMEMENGDNRL